MILQSAFNYNNPINVIEFVENAERILKEVEAECGWLYETLHSDGTTKGKINYTVWSDVFISPFSGNEFAFFEAAFDKATNKVRDEFPCPDTGATLNKKMCHRSTITFYDEAINKEVTQVKQIPVLINYTIRVASNGKWRESTFDKTPNKEDLDIIQKIQDSKIPYWFPSDKMMLSKDDRWGDAFRAGYHLGISHVHHFFHKKNLWALSALKARCNSPILNIWFTSQLVNLSRLNRYRPGVSFPYNPLSGTLYIGSQISEANIFTAYRNKIKRVAAAINSVKANNIVYVASATNQPIPDNQLIIFLLILLLAITSCIQSLILFGKHG